MRRLTQTIMTIRCKISNGTPEFANIFIVTGNLPRSARDMLSANLVGNHFKDPDTKDWLTITSPTPEAIQERLKFMVENSKHKDHGYVHH